MCRKNARWRKGERQLDGESEIKQKQNMDHIVSRRFRNNLTGSRGGGGEDRESEEVERKDEKKVKRN